VKLHDFGLWFFDVGGWSATVPRQGGFYIFYDGELLGFQYNDLNLTVTCDRPYIIRLKNRLPAGGSIFTYTLKLDSIITLDDFDIIPNPLYES
jgi:hypothetical protein